MKNSAIHQLGFTIVEAIVTLVAIGVVGAGGILIYHHDKTKVTSAYASNGTTVTSTAQPISQSDTSTKATQSQTLDITQWGVHLTLNSTTSSMYYSIDSQLPDVAYLSLKTISDIEPKCAPDSISLGAISRLTPDQHDSALSNPAEGVAGTIQIGDYWYGFTPPQATCFTNSDSSAVSQALPEYNAQTMSDTFNTLAAD